MIVIYNPTAGRRRAQVLWRVLDVLAHAGMRLQLAETQHAGHATELAREAGVTVSCDLNYRGKLWTPAEAQETMRPLMTHVDVCIGSGSAAAQVLGVGDGEGTWGLDDDAGYGALARSLPGWPASIE